jgi:hypothetical protein
VISRDGDERPTCDLPEPLLYEANIKSRPGVRGSRAGCRLADTDFDGEQRLPVPYNSTEKDGTPTMGGYSDTSRQPGSCASDSRESAT